MASYSYPTYHHDNSSAIVRRIRQLDAEIAAARSRSSSSSSYTPTYIPSYTGTYTGNTYTGSDYTGYIPYTESSSLWSHWYSLVANKHGNDYRWKSFFNRIRDYDDLSIYKVDDSWTRRADTLSSNIGSLQKHLSDGDYYKTTTYSPDYDYTPTSLRKYESTPYYSPYYSYYSETYPDYSYYDYSPIIKCARATNIYDDLISSIDNLHTNLSSISAGHTSILNKVPDTSSTYVPYSYSTYVPKTYSTYVPSTYVPTYVPHTYSSYLPSTYYSSYGLY